MTVRSYLESELESIFFNGALYLCSQKHVTFGYGNGLLSRKKKFII
jgi:hypothetical protein